MATPSPTIFESTSRRGFLSLVSPKRRFPVPSTTGNTISRSSSTRSCSTSVCTSRPLPWTTMSPSFSRFSFATSCDVAPQHGRVVPLGFLEGRGDDVLGHGVELVSELAVPRRPGGSEALVGHPPQQQGLGREGLVELELV